MINHYSEGLTLGHKFLNNLFDGPVYIEEKVDGSQISFCISKENPPSLFIRSKNKPINVEDPEGMFKLAVEYIKSICLILEPGWIYRGEYLQKPKHNVLAYNRVPRNNIVIWDIDRGDQDYLDYEEKKAEADRIDLECVPLMGGFLINDINRISGTIENDFLKRESFLGGQLIEGVVIKNYTQLGKDNKIVVGKYVSPKFKEIHKVDWKERNPGQKDILLKLVTMLKTDARYEKAVQHLKEDGLLTGTPKDIGALIKEIKNDIQKECTDLIKDELYNFMIDNILRGVCQGLPEWYKGRLMGNETTEI